jgi:GNAT superfamily N-acetyltransferase
MTFELRKFQLLKIAEQGTSDRSGKIYGGRSRYRILFVFRSSKGVGEIESVFVEEAYRRKGIGTTLVSRAIDWMDYRWCGQKKGLCPYGNEELWKFLPKVPQFRRGPSLNR